MNLIALDICSREEAQVELEKIGVDNSSIKYLIPKLFNTVIKLEKVSIGAANIIKQTALSCGTDAAIARGVIVGDSKKSDVLLFGNYRQIENIAIRIKDQPFGLTKISEELLKFVSDRQDSSLTINIKSRKMDLSSKTYICGIINVTPDSFSDGGLYFDKEKAIERGYQLAEEGADMIDIGGESTRPGAEPVEIKEEIRRVIPVIEGLNNLDIPISIDTYKSEVAKEALCAGCEIVNSISGSKFDPNIISVISDYSAGYIITHIKGTPRNMQENPHYESVTREIINWLCEEIEIAEKSGIESDRIMIDPGIGFGKRNPQDNLFILKKLKEFKVLRKPIFVGISRKSFIGKVLDTPIEERLEGSLAASVVAILNGANILRTHDVKQTVRAAKMVDAIIKSNIKNQNGFY